MGFITFWLVTGQRMEFEWGSVCLCVCVMFTVCGNRLICCHIDQSIHTLCHIHWMYFNSKSVLLYTWHLLHLSMPFTLTTQHSSCFSRLSVCSYVIKRGIFRGTCFFPPVIYFIMKNHMLQDIFTPRHGSVWKIVVSYRSHFEGCVWNGINCNPMSERNALLKSLSNWI